MTTSHADKLAFMKRQRDVKKYIASGHFKYSTLASLESHPLTDGLHSLSVNDRWFDFLFENRQSNTTLIVFNAALPKSIKRHPFFSGRAVAEELDINYLGFTDPAQGGQESLHTFWHMSTKYVDTLTLVPTVLGKIREANPEHRLIFFGSSAGGFAALNFSAQFPNSIAVPMNPRISLMHYPYRYMKYVQVSHPGVDPSQVARTLPFNQAKLYSSPRGNQVFYIQNMQDEHYVRHHYAHFRKATLNRPDVEFITGDWGAGHSTPPRDVYMNVLQKSITDGSPSPKTKSSKDLRF